MESTNLKPLCPSDDGRDYVKQAVSLPTKLQRTQALRAINASHINVSLDVLEHLLKGDNIFQRESALDLSQRIIELHRRDLLNARFQSLFAKSSFPLRNIVWLSCQIGIGIPEDTVLRIYTHSDREAVLPISFIYTVIKSGRLLSSKISLSLIQIFMSDCGPNISQTRQSFHPRQYVRESSSRVTQTGGRPGQRLD